MGMGIAISGHSMGGLGALVLGLRHPELFTSISAFAPIVAPSQCPWGQKAFGHYLGQDRALWKQWDAVELVKMVTTKLPTLIHQGLADQFYHEQLKTQLFVDACQAAGFNAEIKIREGYDHSYYFISSFIGEHLSFHHQHQDG